MVDTIGIDFLSVRKIPLKERNYLLGEGEKGGTFSGDVEERPEDAAVESTLSQIRSIVLKDRDIYDKVRPLSPNKWRMFAHF